MANSISTEAVLDELFDENDEFEQEIFFDGSDEEFGLMELEVDNEEDEVEEDEVEGGMMEDATSTNTARTTTNLISDDVEMDGQQSNDVNDDEMEIEVVEAHNTTSGKIPTM
jgi:hypothetical protein